MKRITETGWQTIAQRRIRKAIRNIEAGEYEYVNRDCPVCKYMVERGIHLNTPTESQCRSYWTSDDKIRCPAWRSCKEFIYIIDHMLYQKSILKRLRILLRSVGG
jgi:hypothetical protein